MRLNSATIRNYRVHREVTVVFDRFRTLIGGPNECGKSTLVEAVHRAFFLRSRVGGEMQKSMISTRFSGLPEVEVGFTTGGSDYILTKRFSGGGGTTRLAQAGGQTWHGDDAETRLTSLLKVEEAGGGSGVAQRLARQWSHLWVLQGQSGGDPSDQATQQRDGLLHRLQQIGGAAALQSELDSRVAAHFATMKDETFTQAGRPKMGSELEKAESDANQAETNRQHAAERVEKLIEAAREFDAATLTIGRADSDLQQLNHQKEGVEANLSRVAELQREEASQLPDATRAAEKYQDLQRGNTHISDLRVKIQTLQGALQPKNEKTTILSAALENARQHSSEIAQAYDTSANRTRDSRLRRDLAAACVARFEKDARLQELLVKEVQVRGHQEELNRVRQELAKLPEVTAPRLQKLQSLETEFNQNEAALNAMAAGIEVLSTSESVRVGDASLSEGQSQIVTEPTEIAVGKSLRLRISPGGGTSLQEARRQSRESRRELREQLDTLGIDSVAGAAKAFAHHTDLSGKVKNAESALGGLEAGKLPEALGDARAAAEAAGAEVERRTTPVADVTLPTSAADAKPWLATEDRAVEQAESDEAQARILRDAAAQTLALADQALSEHHKAIRQQATELTGLNAQLQLLIQTHGEDEARARALGTALSAKSAAEGLISATRRALAELQPELLATDQTRLKRACDQAGETKRQAETKHAVAQSILRSDGTDDPEAALASAVARARSAQDHLASVRRKAEAIRLLNQFFQDEQRTLAEQFTKPFAERISAYLQCLFGAGARATVTLVDNAFGGLQLVRPLQGGGATSFDTLSGGAREQVAAAVRLAIAEVLAADHDGCLPLVFDDAFAYSDPERVQTLQRMLDLAATRGLQLIILTCNPSDYSALGAHQVSLPAERPTLSGQSTNSIGSPAEALSEFSNTDSATASAATEPTSIVAVSDELREQLLSKLQELDGKAGNMALREALNWSDVQYDFVKNDLLSRGAIQSGRGRGGSVFLPTP